ncbi:hypothetical protein [Streptomyces silvensis]|uniref:DNA primase/polymerase bifunctional N-terminal domain-containing protein n=1 Tax=Streptomyces silvensis TaxID=1765722 RepID=A0A0W7WYJ4_9ACTN|nr:hypothetical protein [Streptomyces silvensis]KUF15642.1 hypothetical protein AT728_12865 [Streptomyces silvensis]
MIRIARADLDWLLPAGADLDVVTAAWDNGTLAPIPVGRLWDAIQLPKHLGWPTLNCLHRARHSVGASLQGSSYFYVLVPPGGAAIWKAPATVALSWGDKLAVPDPAQQVPLTPSSRTWIIPPRLPLALSNPTALRNAYLAARREATPGI